MASSTPLIVRDSGSKALQRELEQLQKAASPRSGYGSTTAAAQAAWQLGLIYLHGAGVRIDLPQAQLWFERAAKQGREPWAYAGLAWCAIDGCGAPANPGEAAKAISRLRATYPARADFLAWLQASRLKPIQVSTPANTANPISVHRLTGSERQLLERAAAAGDTQANIELGIQAFASRQMPLAENYLRRAASRSVVAANNLTAVRRLEKNGLNAANSFAAPSSAAPEGSAQAALNMARMYHLGQGVPANYAEALRFYRLAEQRGSKEAHKMIELIFSRPLQGAGLGGGLDPAWMQQLARADLSQTTPVITTGSTTAQLQREPSPLFDLLAQPWQRRLLQITQ
ncbi:SEL1-like repeat protein [Comamonas sp. Y33R10-2]|uniref:tetratricopeptide repeat protein n=1 Tax=Comamonas sp. Y33R10-2 TaxID=2853257 RepID=UPI001C5C865E|nr:SEL1-like repeat protein [Comamonas sp. Y33R10-2]QXZ11050.1 SEL1-like repeat protein [Comamonas sp. Y33R10-2]